PRRKKLKLLLLLCRPESLSCHDLEFTGSCEVSRGALSPAPRLVGNSAVKQPIRFCIIVQLCVPSIMQKQIRWKSPGGRIDLYLYAPLCKVCKVVVTTTRRRKPWVERATGVERGEVRSGGGAGWKRLAQVTPWASSCQSASPTTG